MDLFNFLKRKEIANLDYESTLFKKVNADTISKNIKLLVISDTHGDLTLNKNLQKKLQNITNYDLCCILGDVYDTDYEVILDIVPKNKIVALLGNHDRFDLIKDKGVKDLNGKIVNVGGIIIGGIEGSYKYKMEDFPSFTHKDSIAFVKTMPKVDILLSHDKPFIFDCHNPVHDGIKGITKFLYDNKVPLNIHGHLHKTYKSKLKNGTIIKGVYGIELVEIKSEKIL